VASESETVEALTTLIKEMIQEELKTSVRTCVPGFITSFDMLNSEAMKMGFTTGRMIRSSMKAL
jgi:hypothetical protein